MYSTALSLSGENACAEMVDGRRPLTSLVAAMVVRFFGMMVQSFENSVASLETLRERIILWWIMTQKWLLQMRRECAPVQHTKKRPNISWCIHPHVVSNLIEGALP